MAIMAYNIGGSGGGNWEEITGYTWQTGKGFACKMFSSDSANGSPGLQFIDTSEMTTASSNSEVPPSNGMYYTVLSVSFKERYRITGWFWPYSGFNRANAFQPHIVCAAVDNSNFVLNYASVFTRYMEVPTSKTSGVSYARQFGPDFIFGSAEIVIPKDATKLIIMNYNGAIETMRDYGLNGTYDTNKDQDDFIIEKLAE